MNRLRYSPLGHLTGVPAERQDQEAADLLSHLAEPLFPEPPHDQWSVVRVSDETTAEFLRIPFVQAEVDAIEAARVARDMLQSIGASSSGGPREFYSESQLFPQDPHGLEHRPAAVWGILTAACAAEKALVVYSGTAWQPDTDTAKLYDVLINLPDKLIAHGTADTA